MGTVSVTTTQMRPIIAEHLVRSDHSDCCHHFQEILDDSLKLIMKISI